MKILLFEFITGGGLSRETMPSSLAKEGGIMLRALVDDLLTVEDIELYVPMDWRLAEDIFFSDSEKLRIITVSAGEDFCAVLSTLIKSTDAVWPIAPESEGILSGLCRFVTDSGKILLSSSVRATVLTSNKYITCTHLRSRGVVTPAAELLSGYKTYKPGKWIIKPVDGAGCDQTWLIENESDYRLVRSKIDNAGRFIIQPFVPGASLSLSCLFKQGRVWLLCCNEQRISTVDKQIKLTECIVNTRHRDRDVFQRLMEKVAQAIPGLWGYAGIDFIATEQGLSLLEINPRLTTSYAGIRKALGFNVAENVLQLLIGEPRFSQNADNQVSILIPREPLNVI